MDGGGENRVERREQTRKRNRLIVIVAVVVVVIVVGVVAALALSGGGSGKSNHSAAPSTTHANTTITLTAGNVSAASAGPNLTVTPAQTQAIMTLIRNYIQIATVQPLRTGQPAGDMSSIFNAATLAQVNGPDRAVMTDEGLPKVTGALVVSAQPVSITGLGDQQGNLVLLAAQLQLTVDGQVKGSQTGVAVQRNGDFVVQSNGFGSWQVTSYAMSVNRAGAGVDTSASTGSASSTTPTSTTKKSK
jgi:hypothetical protein